MATRDNKVLWKDKYMYSKTRLKGPLKKKTNIGFQDRLSLNAGQKYCRMLRGEHFAILSTFIKLPVVFKTFVLSIFEWLLKTGFTVYCLVYMYSAVCYTSRYKDIFWGPLDWTLFISLCFWVPVNNYVNAETVSSPNLTSLLGKLDKAVNQYFVHILLVVTDNNFF